MYVRMSFNSKIVNCNFLNNINDGKQGGGLTIQKSTGFLI